jgi:hypothetical protein
VSRILDPHQLAREHRQLICPLASREHGQLVGTTGARGRARAREGAREAARAGRRAQCRAELHEPLIEIARRRGIRQRRHHRPRAVPERPGAGARLDVKLDREHAREHAGDVAIHQRRALAERDRGDRACGVRPDPGNRTQLGRGARQLPRAHHLRATLEVACAGVVAEPAPRREHVVEWRRGERGERREPGHPALPVRDHGGDPGLLQHHLAHPDRVRISRAPPRQVAAGPLVVRDHRLGDVARARQVSDRGGP